MRDLRSSNVGILTLGQYLRATPTHLPVICYVTPEECAAYRRYGKDLGFAHVEAGPLVRSSYHAAERAASAARI